MINGNQSKERHIVLITDDNYVMPTKVVITSLSANIAKDDDYKYIVHVCTFGINDVNKELLRNCTEGNLSVYIEEIDKSLYKEKFEKINQKSHVTPTALLKFDLCNLFASIDELLYLDSDIIINKNIADLFNVDISDKYLAASFEFWKYLLDVFKYKNQQFEKPEFYFNSGVMLLNLKKFRQDGLSEKLWETKFQLFNAPEARKLCMDQDTLNTVCSKNCLQLPIKFNCNCAFTSGYDITHINFVFDTNYKDGNELEKDAIIIHYVGKTDKPWKYIDAKCRDVWDSYYEKAGFNLTSLQRIVIKKDLKYYLNRVIVSLHERGIISTVKYILNKR